MRFLVDASISPIVASALNEAGHDAVHVGEVLPLDAPDEAVLDHAAADDRTIIAADTDFGELLARRAAARPSLILLRRRTRRRPTDTTVLVLTHLPDVERDLLTGAVVVIEEGRIRVRQLPIGGSGR